MDVKLWLPGADGPYAPLVTWGADGSMLLPPGFGENYAGQPLLTLDATCPLGGYELRCRILDAATGRQLDEDRELFEIH